MKTKNRLSVVIVAILASLMLSAGTARADDVKIGMAFLFPIPVPIPIYEIQHEPSLVTLGLLFPIPVPLPVYDYGHHGTMAEPASYGRLETLVRPYSADIYVDGRYLGKTGDFSSRMNAVALKSGKHTLEFKAPGYKNYIADINVSPDGLVSIEYTLQPMK